MESTVQSKNKRTAPSTGSVPDFKKLTADDPAVREYFGQTLEKLLRKVRIYVKNVNTQMIRNAYQFAYEAHIDQLRKSGVPYIDHCLETAMILTELRMDAIAITAALLHDVVEDTGVQIEDVREQFGDEVARLVNGVTKISELKFNSQAEEQAENFRKMIFSMTEDLRIITIKFADRLHNMRTLEYLSPKKAERIALETREIYAPLAHRFGIARIKWEMEDLSLKILDSQAYYSLVNNVQDKREDRERYIKKMSRPIRKELMEHGIHAEILGRPKSLYSIYRKMKKRNKPFGEIYDLLAIRIIVEQTDECYFALGVVHTLFTPVHDRFKDYIATPKINMYQSLHTTVIGVEGKMVEIQIRTKEMHRIAEIGIAAHWKYKEGKSTDDELDRYSAWLRDMIDWQKDSVDPEEFMDILKTDLFRSEIFVFTPKGDLLKLPRNASPVDFAFAVHTDVGFHCIGAKVNGRIVPLNSELKNGDSVEIITSSNQRPHQDWLTFVKTSKSKSKIKRWLKDAQFHEAVKLGEEILSRESKKLQIKTNHKQLKEIAEKLGKNSLERLYADLGAGELSFNRILEILDPEKYHAEVKPRKPKLLERFVNRARDTARGVRVQGIDQLLIRFAQCCHPVPGDPILGFITKGRGIVVHRRDCVNLIQLTGQADRTIEVTWDVEGDKNFVVQLRILATGRKDFLKDVAEFLASMSINIIKMDMKTENAMTTAYIILEVRNLTHLTQIMRRLYKIKGILSVTRDSGSTSLQEFTKTK
ncbi:bifunctional (p)ppGpp synthetase/guanosine-3',5'-bis(diphosphate) 3'-pyrophosphohydrolase [bacterium]|nr:bifunctional (p)ppGpp synthetase/guanosine-3',5'-bis(diphosphate) 3'-pyrophosphohydrolase [bacterium]